MSNEEKNKTSISKELTKTFYEVDEKITKLHSHSSDVFLQLNGYLKDYHKKSKIVSENANNIFTTIVGDEETNMMNDLSSLLTQLKAFRTNTEKHNSETNELLNSLIEKINLAIVQTRNFKQDLLTLGYLIANYKFVMNYHNTEIVKNDDKS